MDIVAGIIAALLFFLTQSPPVDTVRWGLILVAIMVFAYVLALLVLGAGLPR